MAKISKIHLGIKIKRIRGYKGMTQQQLADAIGKTRALISFFERSGQVNKYTLQDIAQALNVSNDEIENVDVAVSTGNENPKSKLPNNLLEHLQNENGFLKETINQQWQLLTELSKKISLRKS